MACRDQLDRRVTVHGLKKRDRHFFPETFNCERNRTSEALYSRGKMSQTRAVNGYDRRCLFLR